jgi:hypothetical protein
MRLFCWLLWTIKKVNAAMVGGAKGWIHLMSVCWTVGVELRPRDREDLLLIVF